MGGLLKDHSAVPIVLQSDQTEPSTLRLWDLEKSLNVSFETMFATVTLLQFQVDKIVVKSKKKVADVDSDDRYIKAGFGNRM